MLMLSLQRKNTRVLSNLSPWSILEKRGITFHNHALHQDLQKATHYILWNLAQWSGGKKFLLELHGFKTNWSSDLQTWLRLLALSRPKALRIPDYIKRLMLVCWFAAPVFERFLLNSCIWWFEAWTLALKVPTCIGAGQLWASHHGHDSQKNLQWPSHSKLRSQNGRTPRKIQMRSVERLALSLKLTSHCFQWRIPLPVRSSGHTTHQKHFQSLSS